MSDMASPARSLVWSGHTDCGKVRKNNEDSFLGLLVDSHGAQWLGKIGQAEVAKAPGTSHTCSKRSMTKRNEHILSGYMKVVL